MTSQGHSDISLLQPLQTTTVLQPNGVHASNDLDSLPQLHFCINYSESQKHMCLLHKPMAVFYPPNFIIDNRTKISNSIEKDSVLQGVLIELIDYISIQEKMTKVMALLQHSVLGSSRFLILDSNFNSFLFIRVMLA